MNSTWEDLYQVSSPASTTDSSTVLIQCKKVCDGASKIILGNLIPFTGHRDRKDSGKGDDDGKIVSSKNDDSALVHSYSRKREATGSKSTGLVTTGPTLTPTLVLNRSPSTRAQAAFEAEKQLWIDLKKFKDTNDRNVISFINGSYVSLLNSITLARGRSQNSLGPHLSHSKTTSSLRHSTTMASSEQDKEEQATATKIESDLLYNLYIRVGDLNRYLKNNVLAKSYYNQARTLNPFRGHAYNQLALISPNRLLQVYYYVRAVCATEESISFAAENLKSQVTKFAAVGEQSNIVALFIPASSAPLMTNANPPPGFSSHINGQGSGNNSSAASLNPIPINPSQVTNWAYMVIIAIYSNNLSIVIEPLFEQSKCWIHEQLCGEDPFFCSGSKFNDYNLAKDSTALLPALDVFLDYVLCLTVYQNGIQANATIINANGAAIKSEKEKFDHAKRRAHVMSALRYHQHRLLINLKMSITSLLAMSDNFALGINSSALKHDYALLGFSHLSLAHSKLIFDEGSIPKSNEFIMLIKRINDKIRIVEGVTASFANEQSVASSFSPQHFVQQQITANPLSSAMDPNNHFTKSSPNHALIARSGAVINSPVSPTPANEGNRVRKSRNAILNTLLNGSTNT